MMVIGLTDPMSDRTKLQLYTDWLKRGATDLQVALLSVTVGNPELLDLCQGLVLSGGGDMHPRFFGREDLLPLCKDVSEERDAFELSVLHRARERRMPVLAICRGAQVLNVGYGGTLIPDIEKAGFVNHRTGDAVQRLHLVRVMEGTRLHTMTGVLAGEANTFHHQAVDRPGDGLRVSAFSHDGVVEAIEGTGPAAGPFILGVQWHPERLRNPDGPFAAPLLREFVRAAREYATVPDTRDQPQSTSLHR